MGRGGESKQAQAATACGIACLVILAVVYIFADMDVALDDDANATSAALAANRAASIEGGGSNTVGTCNPTVSTSQTKMIQAPKNTGTASEMTEENAWDNPRADSDFSTASHPISQHPTRNGQLADGISPSSTISSRIMPAMLAARSTRASGISRR